MMLWRSRHTRLYVETEGGLFDTYHTVSVMQPSWPVCLLRAEITQRSAQRYSQISVVGERGLVASRAMMLMTKLEVVVVVVVAERGKISYHLPLAQLCQLPTANTTWRQSDQSK